MNLDVSSIFNKFASKEVHVEEVNFERHGKAYSYADLDENDPTIIEVKKTAKKSGLSVRFILPGWCYTADYRTDRVNVGVVKGVDGKWRISGFGVG